MALDSANGFVHDSVRRRQPRTGRCGRQISQTGMARVETRGLRLEATLAREKVLCKAVDRPTTRGSASCLIQTRCVRMPRSCGARMAVKRGIHMCPVEPHVKPSQHHWKISTLFDDHCDRPQ